MMKWTKCGLHLCRLDTRANNFERGTEDVFIIKTPPIGEALALDVWHNNSGLGSAWHLQTITLINTNTAVAKACQSAAGTWALIQSHFSKEVTVSPQWSMQHFSVLWLVPAVKPCSVELFSFPNPWRADQEVAHTSRIMLAECDISLCSYFYVSITWLAYIFEYAGVPGESMAGPSSRSSASFVCGSRWWRNRWCNHSGGTSWVYNHNLYIWFLQPELRR